MSGQAKAADKLDRFGLRPPRRGVLRGVIRNIRRTPMEAAFGNMMIIDFDLLVEDGVPPVPVQMRGNDFSSELIPDIVVDVADPNPGVRPLLTRRLDYAHNPGSEFVSYFPGRDDPPAWRDRVFGSALVLGPIIGGASAAALIIWYFGLIH
jgi:hypothetical protein